MLAECPVDHWLRLFAKLVVLDVSHYTNNESGIGRAEQDTPAKRVLSWQICMRCGFVDDCHVLRGRTVMISEKPSTEEWNRKRLQVLGRNVDRFNTSVFVRCRSIPVELKSFTVGAEIERQRRPPGGEPYVRHGAQSPYGAVVYLSRTRAVAAEKGNIDRRDRNMSTVEPRIGGKCALQASREEPGTDQENEAESYLRYQQCATQH